MTRFNHLELGPNCPAEDILCKDCPEQGTCDYDDDYLANQSIRELEEACAQPMKTK